MKKYLLLGDGLCLIGLLFSCAQNPFTGKKSLNFVSSSQLFPSSFIPYETFLKENKEVNAVCFFL
ncbi:hypothetical protein [Flavobacterium sp. HJJ]|uniref:hypothetical protein n=1 Tax=Flavobacterium sp. HJJ TaxID=2783792 RepID=UPI00188B6926|nr:hypothetical protein [Flavobacterium sp. HJJ]